MGFFDKLFGSNQQTAPASPAPSQTPADKARGVYEEGVRLIARGQAREGLQRFVDAVKIDPGCVDAHIAFASAFCQIDRVAHSDVILSSTKAALAVDPKNAKALNIASVTHFALGQQAWDAEKWAEATASFQTAYSLDPEGQHVAEALAFCAEQASVLEDVLPAFEQRLATNPTDARAQYIAGRSYIKLAMNGESATSGFSTEKALQRGEQHLREVLRSSPSHSEANYWLGGAYLMAGRDAEALEIINLLRSVDPEKAAELEELRQ
ncbi:MAG: tetratricopeptide repeat protein [Acidobacteria bacterium]|nr:tetratricopeptide repeat protein [Acidobacteriota bacterium]